MRCKVGDLCVVVKTFGWQDQSVIGCFLICKKLQSSSFGQVWEYEPISPYLKTIFGRLALDEHLRPIRPSEGQDETLSWKDVPQGEYA